MPNGRKYWRMRYSWRGKENTLAFGVYPDVSLKRGRALSLTGALPVDLHPKIRGHPLLLSAPFWLGPENASDLTTRVFLGRRAEELE